MFEAIAGFLAGSGGIWSLCISAFVSATLLPGSSEALLIGALSSAPTASRAVLLVAVAALFNTLGSMTSWCIGRYVPNRSPDSTAVIRLKRWGTPAMALAWVPLVGDMLPLAAGWLRMGFWPVLFWTALGKTIRYAVFAAAVLGIIDRL